MTARVRIGRLGAASLTVLLVAGCGGSDSGSSSEPTSADTASAESSDPPASSSAASPSAEPSKVPFDRSVLTSKQPTSMKQPVRLINGAAKGTVIAVQPVSVKPATPAGLAGLNAKNKAEVKGGKAYFLTYKVSYVNGRVESLAPHVTLGLLGTDDTLFKPVIVEGEDAKGCPRSQTAGKTFGSGSSYTECAIEVSSGSEPGTVEYSDYTMPDVRPVWPVG